jgi:hypothetical protein
MIEGDGKQMMMEVLNDDDGDDHGGQLLESTQRTDDGFN